MAYQVYTDEDIVLGEPRNALNPLLAKPPLGRPLTRCYISPFNPDETFGQTYKFSDGGVPAALNHFHLTEIKQTANHRFEKDFITLNKQAAISGGVTGGRSSTLPIPLVRTKQPQVKDGPRKMSPDFMTFGVPTRPSTPVYDLLENRYQDRWIRAQREAEQVQREQEKQARRFVNSGSVHHTRTSLLRREKVSTANPNQPRLWHMAKWGRVQPFLDTYPKSKSRRVGSGRLGTA